MATHQIKQPVTKQYAQPPVPHLQRGQRPAHPFKQKADHALYVTGEFMLKYWAIIITSVLGLLVFSAISVPFLSYMGLDVIAKPILYTLHYVCAQIPSHSFYIFGHQLGLCARNFSIYASMFLFSLIFVLRKKNMPGIPWWLWILLMLPMAWDGFTQMFGLRESDWILRLVTGTLFGVGNMWFVLPYMQKTLVEDAKRLVQMQNGQAPMPYALAAQPTGWQHASMQGVQGTQPKRKVGFLENLLSWPHTSSITPSPQTIAKESPTTTPTQNDTDTL